MINIDDVAQTREGDYVLILTREAVGGRTIAGQFINGQWLGVLESWYADGRRYASLGEDHSEDLIFN